MRFAGRVDSDADDAAPFAFDHPRQQRMRDAAIAREVQRERAAAAVIVNPSYS
ncbi:hypothetical protein [Bradyrhizobium liaoningense]|uniref:hypothetical protein n=1 Tax=Bradyrhizobium liaoningense TaxID=43992 RepID=UPI0018724780|nr:hypothetical protein [Bradyrhizobium liaoningense]